MLKTRGIFLVVMLATVATMTGTSCGGGAQRAAGVSPAPGLQTVVRPSLPATSSSTTLLVRTTPSLTTPPMPTTTLGTVAPAQSPGASDGPALPATLPPGAPPLSVPILMYHFIDDTPPPAGPWSAGLTVNTGAFRQQMDYLTAHGYHPVTLEDVYAAMAGIKALPTRPVALTFDDGNKDNYTKAFPILKAHGFVATFFVVTGFVGNKFSVTWDDLREMKAAGMAIESHTYDHKDLRHVDGKTLQQELAGSRDTILRQLGVDSLVLCYPSGKTNPTVVAAAQAAGYLMAVTNLPGRGLDAGSRYNWPRVRVDSKESIKQFISGIS